jgi:cytoskeleton protein RodZ
MSEENPVRLPVEGEVSEVAVSPTSAASGVAPEGLVPPSVGQQLRAAREARGMSAADVAKVLKLGVNQVVALEADDWSRLPGNTFARGFVRNYARLFKLDAESLMRELSALEVPQSARLDMPDALNTALPETGTAGRRDFVPALLGLVLVVLAVLIYFFMPDDLWQSKLMEMMGGLNRTGPVIEKTDGTLPDAAPAPRLQGTAGTTTPPEVPAGSAASTSAPVPSEAPQAPASAAVQDSGSGLRLGFSQPAWVEIRDRSGQIIFSQLSPGGSQRDIEGQPPFSLVIGNASHVTVEYKGKIVELSQRSKDDVARLNLD